MQTDGRSTIASAQTWSPASTWKDLAFPVEEYDRRVAEVRHAMVDRQIEVLLILTPENINYLTGYDTIGYSSYLCLALPVDADPVLVIREMERGVAMSTTWLTDFATTGDTDDAVERTVDALSSRNLLTRRMRDGVHRSLRHAGHMAAPASNARRGHRRGRVRTCRTLSCDQIDVRDREDQAGVRTRGARHDCSLGRGAPGRD